MLVQSWLVGCFGNASEPNTKTVNCSELHYQVYNAFIGTVLRAKQTLLRVATGIRFPPLLKCCHLHGAIALFFPLNKNRSKQSGQNILKAQWKCLFVLYVFMYYMFLDCYVLVCGNVMWSPLQSYLSIYKLWMQTTLISPKYNFCRARPHTTSPANHFRLLHFMKERRNWWCTESHDCSWAV